MVHILSKKVLIQPIPAMIGIVCRYSLPSNFKSRRGEALSCHAESDATKPKLLAEDDPNRQEPMTDECQRRYTYIF